MPRKLGQELARLDYVALTVIAPEGHAGPARVSIAREIRKRFHDIQTMSWQPLKLHFIVWTPGLPVAERIELEAHKLLSSRHKHGKWFDVPPHYASNAIVLSAGKLHLPIFSHSEMIKRCAQLERSALDKFRLDRVSFFRTERSTVQPHYSMDVIEPPARKRKKRKRRFRTPKQAVATKQKPSRDHPFR